MSLGILAAMPVGFLALLVVAGLFIDFSLEQVVSTIVRFALARGCTENEAMCMMRQGLRGMYPHLLLLICKLQRTAAVFTDGRSTVFHWHISYLCLTVRVKVLHAYCCSEQLLSRNVHHSSHGDNAKPSWQLQRTPAVFLQQHEMVDCS
jgi:hypothetical protein